MARRRGGAGRGGARGARGAGAGPGRPQWRSALATTVARVARHFRPAQSLLHPACCCGGAPRRVQSARGPWRPPRRRMPSPRAQHAPVLPCLPNQLITAPPMLAC
ncbi:hypothetical protein JYU34_016087 [Plutella xylostella]|uniref:Uncharacterized protein n=1 Tax=Plutella xylostella TaxID=51655 RepID=A0ABQ7Q5E3_PLUXY|nr:hypothetical protein JYU34_016087 [Plutella xylostella]